MHQKQTCFHTLKKYLSVLIEERGGAASERLPNPENMDKFYTIVCVHIDKNLTHQDLLKYLDTP